MNDEYGELEGALAFLHQQEARASANADVADLRKMFPETDEWEAANVSESGELLPRMRKPQATKSVPPVADAPRASWWRRALRKLGGAA